LGRRPKADRGRSPEDRPQAIRANHGRGANEALRQATSTAGELLALSGPRSPYPDGPLGVIQEGAYADLILVDGNPLENLDLVAEPDSNFDLIMKDGVIYKNALKQRCRPSLRRHSRASVEWTGGVKNRDQAGFCAVRLWRSRGVQFTPSVVPGLNLRFDAHF